MFRILLFGSNGQLGRTLIQNINKRHSLITCSRKDLNLEETNKIESFIDEIKPDLIINAAAYTNVDQAELNKKLSFLINSEAVEKIAIAALKKNIYLIHYSTDYVFNGLKKLPYEEIDNPEPINVYGKSKLEGELKIQNLLSKFIILRVSWVIGKNGKNFVNKILDLSQKNSSLKIVNDQFGTPTSTNLISKVTNNIIESVILSKNWPSGIYHLSSKGRTSWFEMAKKIVEIASYEIPNFPILPSNIVPIKTLELNLLAKRPLNSILNTSKLKKELKWNLPKWDEDFSDIVTKIISTNKSS